MIPYNEVRQKAKRKNSESNDRLHFFASKFSMLFSWLFINLGLNANQVTLLFFLMGLASCFFYALGGVFSIVAYFFWRLHIIFDLSDGDVARYNQMFSINGSYWDYMIHALLYPLSVISISIGLYFAYQDTEFLFIGMFGGVVMSLNMAVKNNYYRAMLFSKIPLDTNKGKANSHEGFKYNVKRLVQSILSYEGFLFFITIAIFFEIGPEINKYFLVFYMLIMAVITFIKLILFSKKGFYGKRS